MIAWIGHLIRAVSILLVLIVDRLGAIFYKEAALVHSMRRLGPTFIKLGQTLSTRPDIVGGKRAQHLSELQDRLPPFSFKKVRKIIESELKAPLEELFTSIEEVPIAAASIAQVHKGVTRQGKVVAIKVLRPGIARQFAKDLAFFRFGAHCIEACFPKMMRYRLSETVEMFAKVVAMELDMRFEAAAASELQENMQDQKGIYVPSVEWPLTSRRVLTMEWIEGVSIYDKEALLAAGHDGKEIAENLAVAFFHQAYQDGFFHADLHPGNVFVDKEGRIAFVDFGIMGRLDEETRFFTAMIVHGFVHRDYHQVAQVHCDAGYVPRHHTVEEFAQACRSIGEPIAGQAVADISFAALFAQLFKISADFEMPVQPQLLLLQKTMMLVEGVGMILYPEVNMWALAEPWIETWSKEHMGPKAQSKRFLRHVGDNMAIAKRVLHAMDAYVTASQLKRGASSAAAKIQGFIGGALVMALMAGAFCLWS